MTPPIFVLCSADTTLQGLLTSGAGHFKLYPFGEAPELTDDPYVVWQVIDGSPENYISNVPDIDAYTIQVDVYADEASESRAIAAAIQNVIESVAHVTRYNGEWRDPDTRAYRCSFSVDWFVDR